MLFFLSLLASASGRKSQFVGRAVVWDVERETHSQLSSVERYSYILSQIFGNSTVNFLWFFLPGINVTSPV